MALTENIPLNIENSMRCVNEFFLWFRWRHLADAWNCFLLGQLRRSILPKGCYGVTLSVGELAGLSIGMSFLWESHGKHPMGWDSTHLYFPW